METQTKTKERVDVITAAGIIHPYNDPSKIFIEMKDKTHPKKAFRMKLSCIGGYWIGEAAKNDRGPDETFRREVGEELSLEKAIENTLELSLIFKDFIPESYNVERAGVPVTDEDDQDLEMLKAEIQMRCDHFGDYLIDVPSEVFKRADPESGSRGVRALCSAFTVPLTLQGWATLERLQRKFKNLSNESLTVITSLPEILGTGWLSAGGNDHILRDFFLKKGFSEAENFPLMEGITVTGLKGPGRAYYDDYLRSFEVANRP